LRSELLGLGADPGIRMLLPPGWEVIPLDDENLAPLTQKWRATLMQANRPDIDAYLSGIFEHWMGELRDNGGRYAVLPTAGEQILPLSLARSVVEERDRSSLDRWVARRRQGNDAGFLDEDRTVLTWRSTTVGQGEMAGTASDQYNYLIPVPGAQ